MSEDREKKEKTGRTGQGQPGRQDAAKDFDELLRLTYENSPLGMGFISLDGVLMDCNDALAAVIGSPREALIGSRMKAGIIDEGIAVAIAKAFSGSIGVFEGEYTAAGKGTITLRTIHAPLFSRDGAMKGVLFVAEDISERKGMEDRLRESERRYKAIVDSQAEFVVRYLPGGTLTFLNDTLCRYLKMQPEDLLGKSYYPFMHPDDREAFIRKIEALDREHPSMVAEARVVLPDGRVTWHRWNHHAIFGDQGKPVEYQSTGRDVTDIREAEDRLRESEERYRRLYTRTPAMLHSIDPEGRLVSVSDEWLRKMGYEREEVLGHRSTEFLTEDSRKYAVEVVLPEFFRTGFCSQVPYQMVTKSGQVLDVLLSATVERDEAGRILRSLAIIEEITERKQTETALKRSEAKYRRLYNETPVLLHSIDRNGILVEVNDHWLKTLGYERNEVIGRKVTDFFTSPSKRYAEEVIQPAFFRDGIVKDVPYQFVKRNGGVVDVLLSATAERDADGTVARSLAVIQDVTEQKQAETALRESEEKFSKIFRQAPLLITLSDVETGRFLDVNEKFLEISRFTREEVVGRTAIEIGWISEDQRTRMHQTLHEQGRVSGMELTLRRKDGGEVIALYNGEMITVGGTRRLLSIAQDITERKAADTALRKSQTMLETIIDAEPECVKVLDENACLIMMNRAGLDMLQVDSLDQVKGQCVCPMVTSEYRPAFLDLTKRVFRGASGNLVFEMVGAKGRRLWLETHAVPLRNEKDEIVAVLGVTRDITERKRAEEELREKEKRYRTLFEAANDGIFIQDDAGFTDCNRRGAEMYGLTREEVIGRHPREFAPERQPGGRLSDEVAAERIRAALNGVPQTFEWQALRADGTTLDVEVALSRFELGGSVRLQAIVRDITERNRVKEKLDKHSRDLQRLLLISREMTATTDIFRLYRAAVQTAVDLLGFDFSTIMVLSEDKTGLTIMDAIGFPQSMIGTFSLVNGQGLATYVVRSRRPDAVPDFGTETRFEVPAVVRELHIRSALCVPMMLGEEVFGVLIGHSLAHREFSREDVAIYENIGNEAAIAIKNAINLDEIGKSAEKLRNITSNIAEGLYVLDPAGRISFMNEEAERLLGWSVEELNERGAHQLVHFRKADGAPLSLDDCPMHGTIARKARFSSNDEVFVRKDGTVFPISVVCSPIVAEGVVVASVIAFRDITETKRMEQELLKIQKLESVGTLAGGIAHDFNNLLQGVFGYISVAKLSLDQKERAAALLEQAEKALHQSVNLTTQLLTFSKGGKPVRKRIALAPVIENGVRFALSGSQLTYRIDLAQDLLPVEADEGQLGQVIHNIVLNADQAMPLGGRIEIQARNVPASSPELPPVLPRAAHVLISIRDHGTGIPAEYLPRIFDPYFTTKEKGSGLGLATSYAIVRNHGGMIVVSSEPGKGSTFGIFLPASAPVPAAPSVGSVPAGTPRVRVLVMDDEEVVRNVAVELLHELGHDVECAEHGAAAIDAYRKAKDAGRPFDIVILDLTIRGGMGGMETLRGLRELDPQVKAVVSSGYSDDEIVSDFRQRGFSAFLKKPYDMSALRDMLRSLTT